MDEYDEEYERWETEQFMKLIGSETIPSTDNLSPAKNEDHPEVIDLTESGSDDEKDTNNGSYEQKSEEISKSLDHAHLGLSSSINENIELTKRTQNIEINKSSSNEEFGEDDGSPLRVRGPVVRKKAERKQLNGYSCSECAQYYSSFNLTEEELKKKLKDCSRHRDYHSPPKTPEHYWDTDFPSTQECIERGYLIVKEI